MLSKDKAWRMLADVYLTPIYSSREGYKLSLSDIETILAILYPPEPPAELPEVTPGQGILADGDTKHEQIWNHLAELQYRRRGIWIR